MEMFGDSIPSSDGKWIYISMFTKRGGIFSLAERERKMKQIGIQSANIIEYNEIDCGRFIWYIHRVGWMVEEKENRAEWMLYSLVESNCLMHMQTTVSIENFLFYFVAVAVYIDFFFFFPPFRTTNHRDSLDFSPNTFFSFVSFILLCTRFGSIDWFLIDCYYCPYANVFPIKHTRLLVIFLFLFPSLSHVSLFSRHCHSIFRIEHCTRCTCL